jgi:hypothetical protein
MPNVDGISLRSLRGKRRSLRPETFSSVSDAGQKRRQILPFKKPRFQSIQSITPPRPPSILFGHAGFSIPYAASKRAPVRARVSR